MLSVQMRPGGLLNFKVTARGEEHDDLSARVAASKARSLRRAGFNDVEIFREDGSRISLYALDQMIRAQPDED